MTTFRSVRAMYKAYLSDNITWSMYVAYLPDIRKNGFATIPFDVFA